jgi:hypothetical protein
MGLNVCKRIVSFFNGDLSVTSQYEHGTNFSFTFQCVDLMMEANENDKYANETISMNDIIPQKKSNTSSP